MFNRDYAKFIISKFDSLEHFRTSFFDCIEVLEKCNDVKDKYKELSNKKEQEIVSLNKQILYCDELAESYNKSEMINKQLQKDLQRQLRKTKVWNGIGWGAIATTAITSIFLILR